MSDAHNEHESVIKTPKQLIAAVAAGFLVPIICIVLLTQYVSNAPKTGAGSDSQTPEAVAARLKPVADVGFTLQETNAPAQLKSGEEVYKSVCIACHGTGAAGAPKMGDNSAWAPRISEGFDTLAQHALHGFKGMPAKGGSPNLADAEVERAIVYMANNSGAKFKEPEVKEAAAPAAPATAPAQTNQAQPAAPAAGAAPAAQAPAPAAAAPAAAAPAAPEANAASSDAGKKLYESTCFACHGNGVAGAPKFGDKAAWAPRLAKGKDTLYQHAIQGFHGQSGVMPPKGGSSASDADVKAAVDYMAAAAK